MSTVIKGNISECKAFYGMTSHAHGVDADIQDEEDIYESCKWLKDMALNLGCVVVCSRQNRCLQMVKRSISFQMVVTCFQESQERDAC